MKNRYFPVSGVEFSPDSFTQRQFKYWRSPFTGAIRSKRILKTVVSQCDSIVALNLIPAKGTTDPRWDLVSESLQTSDVLSADFDARFLTQYLDFSTPTTNLSYYWMTNWARRGSKPPPSLRLALNPMPIASHHKNRPLPPMPSGFWKKQSSLIQVTKTRYNWKCHSNDRRQNNETHLPRL